MQKSTLWLGGKLSLYLLMVAVAAIATTSSANPLVVGTVPETSGGSAELIAVLGFVGAALILRRKNAKKLPM